MTDDIRERLQRIEDMLTRVLRQMKADGSQTDVALVPQRGAARLTGSVVLRFPTVGVQGQCWPLTQAQVDEWQGLYPGVDVLAEARKSLAWLNANPQKRKTPSGMPRMLVNWLNKATNHGGGRVATAAPRETVAERNMRGLREDLAALDDFKTRR